jgi:hypothetical protein
VTTCNWSREPILTALGGVQRLPCGRHGIRSSYLRVVTLYIHPFLELNLLPPSPGGSSSFWHFHTAKSRCLPFTTSRRCKHPMRGRATSRLSVLNLNALALLILNATGLSLTRELRQLYLGRQMVGRQVEIDSSVAVLGVPWRTPAFDAFVTWGSLPVHVI